MFRNLQGTAEWRLPRSATPVRGDQAQAAPFSFGLPNGGVPPENVAL